MEHTVVVARAEVSTSSTCQGLLAESPLCTLIIPNSLLLDLHERGKDYVAGVNDNIKGKMVTLNPSSERLVTSLKKIAGKLSTKVRQSKGSRGRARVREGCSNFLVRNGETLAVETATQHLQERVEQAEQAQEELSTRLSEVESAREAERNAPINRGKSIDEVGERQKRRKLAELRSYATTTLQPCMETYGLTPTTLSAVSDQGTPVTFELANLSTAPGLTPPPPPSDNTTEKVLFLLDQYGVSDSFYHELAQAVQELPRLHHVKTMRKELNTDVVPIRLEPPFHGCYLPIRAAVTHALTSLLKKSQSPSQQSVLLKLSGDGTSFSSTSSFVLLTFSFPALAKDTLAASGNHTYASARGHESNEFLRDCFAPVWKEVAGLITDPVVEVSGTKYHLDIVCGSDYKFLLLLMGLNSATSTYSCLWCTVGKDERWDMSVPEDQYISTPPSGKARTLAALEENCKHSQPKRHLGSKHAPLLPIEPSSLVVDELHLLLRIGDILLRNVILQADSLDNKAYAEQGRRTDNHVRSLELLIRRCGISFTISPVVNENNKAVPGLFSWTALTRKDKLKVMRSLPELLEEVLPPQDAAKIGSLWKDFIDLYQVLTATSPSAEEVHDKAKQWVTDFLALPHLEGHQKKNVTPYMHTLVYHVPDQIRRFGNIIQFSGQGVEKKNDTAKHSYYSSNKHDPCGEMLRIESRQEALHSCRREKRVYRKTNITYWESGIKQKRARQQ